VSSERSCRPIRCGGRATAARSTPPTSRTTRTSRRALRLHAATGDLRWLREARRIALAALELFGDPERGGFFLTPADGEPLVARQKAFDDNPTPAGSSMLAFVLLRLARIWGDDELERTAVGALRLVRDLLTRAPSAFGWALCALDLHLSPPRELAIVGGAESDVARAALRGFDPNAVVAFGPAEDVPLLDGKALVDGQAGGLRLRASPAARRSPTRRSFSETPRGSRSSPS
jgi:uncharacterized protein YyaL (SSP411 family)